MKNPFKWSTGGLNVLKFEKSIKMEFVIIVALTESTVVSDANF